MAVMALGVLGGMGVLLSLTGVFGMAAYAHQQTETRFGHSHRLDAQRKEVLQAALGRAVSCWRLALQQACCSEYWPRTSSPRLFYEATPRDPFVLAGVVLAMALVGLLATWIPAQRALSIDPVMLLREE
jgi:ABC-type lipoprotein release transport system permease subunit